VTSLMTEGSLRSMFWWTYP